MNTCYNSTLRAMCPYCSSAKFTKDSTEPHWECCKYSNTILTENSDKYLVKCNECLKAEVND